MNSGQVRFYGSSREVPVYLKCLSEGQGPPGSALTWWFVECVLNGFEFDCPQTTLSKECLNEMEVLAWVSQ